MKHIRLVAMLTLACLLVAGASFADFEKPCADALNALGAERGRLISSGMLFVDGHYIEAPYTVIRYGNVIKVGTQQVTGQVVSWNSFLATQDGAVATKVETTAPATSPAPAPAAVRQPSGNDLDDLFGDDDPPKSAPAAQSASQPAKQESTVYSLADGAKFVMNAKAQALLDRVNARRTYINKMLIRGDVVFVSSSTGIIKSLPLTMAEKILEGLPEVLRDATGAAAIEAYFKSCGVPANYLPKSMYAQFYEHNTDYLGLSNLRNKVRDKKDMRKLMRDITGD